MLNNANFILEIGTEEIPAGYLPPAIASLEREFGEKLKEHRIAFDALEAYGTPRRLALAASGVSPSQDEEEIELKGPSVKAAYDAQGNPTKALEGFLKGNRLGIDDVYRVATDKGEYIYAKKKMESRKTAEIVPDILEQLLKTLPFPKRMRWSDKKISFPRPIAYFLVMLDDAVVPFEASGIRSANLTRAHFIQHRGMIEVKKISEYEHVLRDGGVLLDHRKRKDFIRAELEKAARELGGTLVSDDELIDTVTFLTESPYIVACRFEKEFLAVPDIVLIEEMKVHQKYFAVRDVSGSLMPHFLVVSNNPPTARIREGNERVIAARFTDARFFFKEDRRVSLADKVESLKGTLFHKELGSIFDKLGRMQRIGGLIAGDLKLDGPTCEKIERALYLCKADLNTAMVFEFTSLQGRIGRVYAQLDGEDAEVAAAIEDQYRPRFQGDPLPEGMVSIAVSLAEKIDNILGSYSVGNVPKGSQDPYALRRQAGAVVEMLLDSQIGLDLRSLLERCAGNYKNGRELIPKILEFFGARANTIFTERGLRYDEIDACLSTDYYDYLELYRRARSINEFRRREEFSEMLLSFKRMNNILSSFRQKNPSYTLRFDDSLLSEPEERELFRFFESRMQDIEGFIKSNSYVDLFALLIEGKPVIDAFFDAVMVMVEDVRVRDNRLAMLESILSHFTGLLNFFKISE